jgi:beta-lactamase class A
MLYNPIWNTMSTTPRHDPHLHKSHMLTHLSHIYQSTKIRLITYGILLFLGGFLLGIVFVATISDSTSQRALEEQSDTRKKGVFFTSPLLECAENNPVSIKTINNIRDTLTNYIVENQEKVEISLYFRDLNNGGWIELNQNELYQPASLMKLPIAIAAYKRLEQESNFFDTTVIVGNNEQFPQNVVTGKLVSPNEKLTIRELLYRSMVYSDNRANESLASAVGLSYVTDVIKDFNVAPLSTLNEYHVSPREYASFFRILYNATYLSHVHSEELLSIMAESPFSKGLVAGIPKDIRISHKFGERKTLDENSGIENYQLHDCGIVYGSRPYLLCVMSKGDSFDALYKSISDISRMVYQYTLE